MFNWYRLFNLTDFESTGLTSHAFVVELEAIGPKEILITKGNSTSILYEDAFLTIGLNDKNPFRYGERAVYLDDNDDVWLGVYDAD
jgi:hypothetical protein